MLSFLQLVGVADTDEQAEELYGRHVEFFYKKLLHVPPHYFAPPGYCDYKSLLNVFTRDVFEFADYTVDLKPLTARDMIEREFVVVGSPATVRERLEATARTSERRPSDGDPAVRLDAARAGDGEHRAVRS